MTVQPLLSVRDLTVTFTTADGPVDVLRGVSFDLQPGGLLAVVAPSGSGKTVTMLAVSGLLRHEAGAVLGGQIHYRGTDLLDCPVATMRRLWTQELGLVFQDPVEALNPVATVGAQIAERIRRVRPDLGPAEVRSRCVEALRQVGVQNAELRIGQYRAQLSSGLCQRAMVAMALANVPRLLIADEPTCRLDDAAARRLLGVLDAERRRTGLATIVTAKDHDPVLDRADVVIRLERGRTRDADPARVRQPVALAPSAARPPASSIAARSVGRPTAPRGTVALRVEGLRVHFPVRDGRLQRRVGEFVAVDGVDLALRSGEAVGLIGPSPSGRSVLGRAVVRLLAPTAGSIRFEGADIAGWSKRRTKRLRPRLRHVDGEPAACLDPRASVQQQLEAALKLHQTHIGARMQEWIATLMRLVGLSPEHADARLRELGPEHRQVLGLARVVVTRPAVVVLDDPLATLDLSVRAYVLDALARLRDELGLALLLIAHEPEQVAPLAHRMVRMRNGKLVS